MQALWFLPLIIACIVLFVFNLIKTPSKIALHFLTIVFLITYGLSGWYGWFNYQNDLQIYPRFVRNDFIFIVSALLIFLSYFTSLYGYRFANKIEIKKSDIDLSQLISASNISFFLMLLFTFVYILQYGGLSKSLNTAAAIRSGYGELESSGSLTFTKYLMPIGVFPFLTYAYLAFIDKQKKYFIPFIVTTLFLLLAFTLMSGRTRIVMYVLALGIIIIMASDKKVSFSKVIKLSPLIFISTFLILYGKKLFSSIEAIKNGEGILTILGNSENKTTLFESLVGYFSHRVYSVEVALNDIMNNNGSLIFFRDSFYLPLYFIPERLTGIAKPDSISYHNTELLTGVYDSMAPPGILAYGLYSLWIPGIFIIAFLYGAGFGYIDRLLTDNYNNKKLLIVIIPLLLVWSLYGSTGDTRIVINGIIYIILYIFILLMLKITTRFNHS